jgi:hypothetical protein
MSGGDEMSDAVEGAERTREQIVRSDVALRSALDDYGTGNLPAAQLLEAFMAHSQPQADYKSTILTMMLANGCPKEEVAEFIGGCIGVEWTDVLPGSILCWVT